MSCPWNTFFPPSTRNKGRYASYIPTDLLYSERRSPRPDREARHCIAIGNAAIQCAVVCLGDPKALASVNLDDGSHIPIAANLLDALLNIIVSNLERRSFQFTRGLAARAFIKSCTAICGLLCSDLPTVDEVNLDLQSNVLMFVLKCVTRV